jgi:outer membrane protein assembly factor BamB
MRRTRRSVLAAGAALLGAGCLSGDGPGTATTTASDDATPNDVTTTGEDTTGDDTTTTTSEPTVRPESALGWTRTFDAAVAFGPVARRDTLYVGTADGVLYAFAADGTERWSADVGGAFFSGTGPDASPVVADGTVYLTTGSQSGPHGTGYRLYALDAADGRERWHHGVDYPDFLSLLGVAGGRAYAATSDDNFENDGETLYAYAPDGTERWTAEVGDPREASVSEDAVAVATWGSLQVVGADGTERFATDRFGRVAGLGFADGRLLVASDDVDGGGLYGVDPESGGGQWSVDRFVNSMLLDDRAYVGGKRVAAYAFDGERAWNREIEAFVERRRGDLVYASTFAEGGGAEALALAVGDGTVRWRHATDGETAEVVDADDRLAVLSLQGVSAVEGIDPATGERRVRVETGDARTLGRPTVLDGRGFVADGPRLYALAP